MTLLFVVIVLAVGSPFLFRHMERRGSQHRAAKLAWRGALAACVGVPVLVVAIGTLTPASSRIDVPLPLLILMPISWSIWFVLRRQPGNTHAAS